MRTLTFILVLPLSVTFAQVRYAGGVGTANEPYLIHTAEELNAIGLHPEDWYKHFKLMADIDLSGFDGKGGRAQFNIIAPDADAGPGFQGRAFTGVFHGNNHTVSHLTIGGTGYLGLFGRLGPGAVVEALGVVDFDISGSGGSVGGLVGFNDGGRVAYCYSSGQIDGEDGVGGLVGSNSGEVMGCYSNADVLRGSDAGGLVGMNSGSVVNCHSTGAITGAWWASGGLVGSNSGAVIGCCSTSTVRGDFLLGGLVGANTGRVTHCYSSAEVDGAGWGIGGLVGENSQGAVVTCSYSLGFVNGEFSVGGLVGVNEGDVADCHSAGAVWGHENGGGLVGSHFDGVVNHCFSCGRVTGEGNVGGLFGSRRGGSVTGCFWDIQASGLTNSWGGAGRITAEMQRPGTFLDAGWDFVGETDNGTEDVWYILEGQGYPRLAWELSASSSNPQDGAMDVVLSPTLSWLAIREAVSCDIYFGDNKDEIAHATTENTGLYRGRRPAAVATYDPGALEWGTTYYWRIDGTDEARPNGLWRGDVWHFTTVPFAWPIEDIVATSNADWVKGSGPEHTIDGSGLNNEDQHSAAAADMWLSMPAGIDPVYIQYQFDRVYKLHEMLVWNWNEQFEPILGYGAKDMIVAYSEDGMDWRSLREVVLDQAPGEDTYTCGTTVDFGGVTAQYVRLSVKSTYGMRNQVGLSEVRFLYIPVWAYDPWPADGATEVTVDSLLTWCAGREAVWHEVYLSTDQTALGSESTLIDSTQFNTVEPGSLNLATTYYWQVNEVNEAEDVGAWDGDVWEFTTQEFLVIDDFESYTDDIDAGEAIWQTWLDGWVNGTGSVIGYVEVPMIEVRIARSGRQCMPYNYDNVAPPYYSEAYRVWNLPQDWTAHGADTLRLFVSGEAPAFYEDTSGIILMNGSGSIDSDTDRFRFVHKTLSGDGAIEIRIDGITGDLSAKAGVMIRESVDASSPYASVLLTPDQGVSFHYRSMVNGASSRTIEPDLAAPCWVRLTRTGDTFTAECSADGVTWVRITADAETSSVEISMPTDVLVGLAVTGRLRWHEAGAEFAGLSTTGNVAGPWQITGVGGEQGSDGNALESLYVAIEDSTGMPAVVTNPNITTVGSSSWQEWLIPFDRFSDVDLSRVKTMYIGLGNRDIPEPGGGGLIFIDDIQLMNLMP